METSESIGYTFSRGDARFVFTPWLAHRSAPDIVQHSSCDVDELSETVPDKVPHALRGSGPRVSARWWITRNRIPCRVFFLLGSKMVTVGFTGKWLQDIAFVLSLSTFPARRWTSDPEVVLGWRRLMSTGSALS